MRRFIFVLALLASCVRVPEGEFRIEGRVGGLADSAVVELTRWEGNFGSRVAVDTIVGGRFSFAVPVSGLAKFSLYGSSDGFSSMGRDVWAAPGERIVVRGRGGSMNSWRIRSRVPCQREADAYIARSRDEYLRLESLKARQDEIRAMENRDAMRAEWDSLQTLESELDLTIMRNDVAVMNETPVSEVWLEKLNVLAMMVDAYENYREAFGDDAKRLYECLSPEQKESPTGRSIWIKLFPPEKVEVSDRMADAELKAFDGSTHRLSDYAGRYIVLDFWATGCGPCLMSMPELAAVGAKYGERVKIIGINLDATEDSWRQGTEIYKPASLNLNAPPASDVDERYGVNGIPHYVIVSPDGVVIASWSGYREGGVEERLIEAGI